jgi:hypothetical protein
MVLGRNRVEAWRGFKWVSSSGSTSEPGQRSGNPALIKSHPDHTSSDRMRQAGAGSEVKKIDAHRRF